MARQSFPQELEYQVWKSESNRWEEDCRWSLVTKERRCASTCLSMSRQKENFRIVIADDHELVRRGIRSILTAHRGWRVVGEASDGMQAARMTQILRPHVLIMDITMPQLDGLEAT